jgi:hypothetical protein
MIELSEWQNAMSSHLLIPAICPLTLSRCPWSNPRRVGVEESSRSLNQLDLDEGLGYSKVEPGLGQRDWEPILNIRVT